MIQTPQQLVVIHAADRPSIAVRDGHTLLGHDRLDEGVLERRLREDGQIVRRRPLGSVRQARRVREMAVLHAQFSGLPVHEDGKLVLRARDDLGQGHGPFYEPGIKRLGTWVHLLFTLTQFLSHTADERMERIARFCAAVPAWAGALLLAAAGMHAARAQSPDASDWGHRPVAPP